jgi:hypothetical protein
MFSKVELLAMIKIFNKKGHDKIKNADKMSKDDMLLACKQYGIIPKEDIDADIKVDLRNVKKTYLLQDIEVHFLKQNKQVPPDVQQKKKKELIEYMELNNIQHYTYELLEKEVKFYEKKNMLKNMVVLHIIKYDDIDVQSIPDNLEELEAFVQTLTSNDDINLLPSYSILLKDLYDAYDKFCKMTSMQNETDKIKSFPKILAKLQKLCQS